MKKHIRLPSEKEQALLERVEVRPARVREEARCERLLKRHHYMGTARPVGERLYYVALSPHGGWLAVLVFCAAAKHLKHREQWIGWTNEQRRRRLGLVVNNVRFLIVPGKEVPNLGSRILRLTADRLSDDWQKRYGHPLCVVETFVDPQQFQGTVYTASGWVELGQTSGYRRCNRDYYVRHSRPKRLFVRELYKNARRSLQAEHLKPALAVVEQKVAPRCTLGSRQLRSLVEHFKSVPDFRGRIASYPVWSLLAIVALAHLCGAPRGQKDLAGFAKRLTEAQRRALGIRRHRRTGKYPAPSQPTFCRLLRGVDPIKVEEAILAFQEQLRGPAPKAEVVAIDGKEPKHSRGQHLLTAVAVPSQYYLGSAPVDEKTNEIPVARDLIRRLDLEGCLVGLDALHTQQDTARDLVQECGADYLLTAKGNQKGLRRTVKTLLTATPAAFSPSGQHVDNRPHRGMQSQPNRSPVATDPFGDSRTDVLSSSGTGGAAVSQDRQAQTRNGMGVDQPGTRADECSTMAAGSTGLLGDRGRSASEPRCLGS